MIPNKILYTNNIYGYSAGYQSKIDLDNRFIDSDNSSIDIIGKYIGFPYPLHTLTTDSIYMYIKPLSTGDFEMRLLNVPNTIITTDWSNLRIDTQFIWNWCSTTGIQKGFINPNATGNDSIMRFYGSDNQYIYYDAVNNLGSYNSLTSTTLWSISSNGSIKSSDITASGAITGTSLSVTGDGNISTTTGNITTNNITLNGSNGSITSKSINLNSTTSDSAILVYSINSIINERKYLQKFTKDLSDTNDTVVTFCNIINDTTDMLTFTGKIVVVSGDDSEHFTFSGYKNKNNINFTLNNLTPSYFDITKISINLSEKNVIITIANSYKQGIISLESINI